MLENIGQLNIASVCLAQLLSYLRCTLSEEDRFVSALRKGIQDWKRLIDVEIQNRMNDAESPRTSEPVYEEGILVEPPISDTKLFHGR